MRTLFISDLHLSAERPEKFDLFTRLLAQPGPEVAHLYILGDLFEVWLGDDDDTPPNPAALEAIATFAREIAPVSVMRGNRDFLMGERFVEATGVTLLPDHVVIDLYGTPTLLMHGDLLCTLDHKYQEFRTYVQSPQVQQGFLSRTLEERRAIAAETRAGTIASMLEKESEIMDVEPKTVVETMQQHAVSQLIHGHTHRPGRHEHVGRDGTLVRHVLTDWYVRDGVLVADAEGLEEHGVEAYLAGLAT